MAQAELNPESASVTDEKERELARTAFERIRSRALKMNFGKFNWPELKKDAIRAIRDNDPSMGLSMQERGPEFDAHLIKWSKLLESLVSAEVCHPDRSAPR